MARLVWPTWTWELDGGKPARGCVSDQHGQRMHQRCGTVRAMALGRSVLRHRMHAPTMPGRSVRPGRPAGRVSARQAGWIVRPARYGRGMDMKLEVVFVPVTDVDRAKAFYVDQVGFNADHDFQVNPELRFVQLTPPGSACSVAMGVGLTTMTPGSLKGVMMVVEDVKAVREQLIGNGVEASEIDVQPWGSFVTFSDPDGNTWSLQELPPRN